MLDFFDNIGLMLSEVFLYMERSKDLEKKYVMTVQKNSPSQGGLTVKTRLLKHREN